MTPARRPRPITLASTALILLLAVLAAGCGKSDDSKKETWKIGLQAPITGDLAQLGEGMLEGAQLAADEINDDGGLLGKGVEVVAIDDKGDPQAGTAAANTAIEAGLDGVVGPYNSGVGLKTLPLFIDDGLVPIRLTSDDATNGLGFTLQPMTYQIAPVAADAMSKWLKAKSVAIIYDGTEAYTKGVAKNVRAQLKKKGVDVVFDESIKPGGSSYSDVVKSAGKSGADVVYLVTYFPEGGLIAKEMHEQKLAAQCLADYGAYDTGFIEAAGAGAKDCPVVGVPAPSDFESASEHVAAFKEKFDAEPGTWSPYTYDSVKFLADGVAKAGGFSEDKLTDTLSKVTDWNGWTGSVSINAENGTREPATLVVLKTDGEGFTVDTDWAKAVGAPYGK
jgi:ABC-type branched-subunit amino acid transport system substrate-binding protein